MNSDKKTISAEEFQAFLDAHQKIAEAAHAVLLQIDEIKPIGSVEHLKFQHINLNHGEVLFEGYIPIKGTSHFDDFSYIIDLDLVHDSAKRVTYLENLRVEKKKREEYALAVQNEAKAKKLDADKQEFLRLSKKFGVDIDPSHLQTPDNPN